MTTVLPAPSKSKTQTRQVKHLSLQEVGTDVQVLAVVQYFQNRDAPDNQEEEIWQKMAGAGPSVHGFVGSPPIGGGEMSREPSHEPTGRVDHFANPVSISHCSEERC